MANNYIISLDDIGSTCIYSNWTSQELYTIAIPTYLRANLLKDTIESVVAQQKVKTSFNILVVDNNPERNDATETLMMEFKNVSNLAYYKNDDNLGMIGNWNRLFLLCDSKYVIMLHDDDIIHPLFMYYIQCAVNQKGEISGMLKPLEYKWKSYDSILKFPDLSKKTKITRIYDIENYKGFIIGAPTGCLINKKTFLEMGGFCSEYKQTAADIEFVLRMGNKYPVYQINERLIAYRISDNESLKVETQYIGVELCYELIIRLLSKYGVNKEISNIYWSYFLKEWTCFIKSNFCPTFSFEEARSRIKLKEYPVWLEHSVYVMLRLCERIYLALHGKIQYIDFTALLNNSTKRA